MTYPRPLTDTERALARWMLENGIPEARQFLGQLDEASVTGTCGCGCATIHFGIEGREEPTGGLHVLGDYLFGDQGRECGAFIYEQAGTLSGLEVWSVDGGDDASRLPRPEELRPFDRASRSAP